MLPLTVPAITTSPPKETTSPFTTPRIITVPPNEVTLLQVTSLPAMTTSLPNDGLSDELVQLFLVAGKPAACTVGMAPVTASTEFSKSAASSKNISNVGNTSSTLNLRPTLSILELPIMVRNPTMTFASYAS